jgi:hypothetical protein
VPTIVFFITFSQQALVTYLTHPPSSVIGIKILIMGHFLLTFRISMGHSLTFFVNISDFNGTFSDGM